MMPSDHLILCRPLLLLPSVFPSIRVFFNESALCISGQNIGASASASVLPMNIQGWFPLWLTGLVSLLSKGLSRVFSSTTVWKHQFFGAQWSINASAWVTLAKSLYLCGLQNLRLSGDGCGILDLRCLWTPRVLDPIIRVVLVFINIINASTYNVNISHVWLSTIWDVATFWSTSLSLQVIIIWKNNKWLLKAIKIWLSW